jgi:hypothetical protein
MTSPLKQISLMHRQLGAIVIVPVVLLLVLVTLVTLSTGRIISFEHRILLNEQNHSIAFSAAESGLSRSLGVLTEDPVWAGGPINEVLKGQGSFNATVVRQTVNRDSGSVTLVTLSSSGNSADGLSAASVSEQAILYSVLANPPDVPLIVAGGLDVSGNFEVVANANGAGNGVPLSIWTDGDVDMNNGSGATCGLQEFKDGSCGTNTYSEKGFQSQDILDNDPAFPEDLMEYMFNVPEAEWDTLRSDANLRLPNCNTLGAASRGLIWVDGDCSLNANVVVGSVNNPVILIVTDGDLTMNGGATINGIVFSFRKPGVIFDFEINMLGGARVNGVVASNHPVGHANGTYNSVYDSEVLAELKVNDAFQRVARVPGSWRDF